MLHLTLSNATIVAAFLVSVATTAQPEVIRCLPPQVPVTDLPDSVLAEYRKENGLYDESSG